MHVNALMKIQSVAVVKNSETMLTAIPTVSVGGAVVRGFDSGWPVMNPPRSVEIVEGDSASEAEVGEALVAVVVFSGWVGVVGATSPINR